MEVKKIKNDAKENKFIANYECKISIEEMNAEVKNVYKENKQYFNIPGFRKGKVPFDMVVKFYGVESFLNDAFKNIVNDNLVDVLEEKVGKDNFMEILSIDNKEEITPDREVIFNTKIAVRADFDVEGYDKIKVKEKDLDKELGNIDELVDNKINQELEQNSREITVEDAKYKAKKGDAVELSFKGSIKDEKGEDFYFPGGTAESHKLHLGSKTFIDNFEEQLVGLKIGEEKEVLVKFPEDYPEETLKGKDAKFECKILNIYIHELPKLDDEFAKDLGYENLDKYKEEVKKEIEEKYNVAKNNYLTKLVIDEVKKINKIELPEELITIKAARQYEAFRNQYLSQGFDIEAIYPEVDSLKNEMKRNVETSLYTTLIIDAIAKKEKIKANKKEINEVTKNYLSSFKDFTEEDLEKYPEVKESLKQEANRNATITYIISKIIIEK